MYNRARGFLAQEFSDSPDVVEMKVGVLAGFCDLHIHFQVGVKNHTQVSHWRHRWDLVLTHMNEWYVYAFELLFTSYNQDSVLLSFTISMLVASSSPVLPHNFQWQWLRLFDSWKENVWMIGRLDGHRHRPGLLGGAFLWSGKGRQHRWWKHRVKAWSLRYSSGQLFLFGKCSFNLHSLSSLRKIWRETFQSFSANTKTGS